MVFTTGQMLGIGAFTAAVLVVGMLLLKLDSVIGTNYDTAEEDTSSDAPSAGSGTPAAATARTRPHRRRHGR